MPYRRYRHRQPKPTLFGWTKHESRSFKKTYGLTKRQRKKFKSFFSW